MILINFKEACCRFTIISGMDPQVVWESHKADQEALETYASAMKELATKHWHSAKGLTFTFVAKKYLQSQKYSFSIPYKGFGH